jgi:uncharacterized low-complexity protein
MLIYDAGFNINLTLNEELFMKKTLGITIGSALLVGLSSTTAQAGENPFAMQELSSGYQLSQSNATPQSENVGSTTDIAKGKEGKCGEAKCGEGKCGGKKK